MANDKWNECKNKIKDIENYISDLYNAQATSTGNLGIYYYYYYIYIYLFIN